MMPEQLQATAVVPTATPDRYAKQLAAHLGRRCDVAEEPAGIRLTLPGGNCLLHSESDCLELTATAPTSAELDQVKQVVGSHLERFGQRHELQVSWRAAW
jgi:hypothetical protein